MNHEWVDDFGSPWHGQADDVCAVCAQSPDAHKEPQPDLVDRQKLLAGLRELWRVAEGSFDESYLLGIHAAFAYVEDFEA